MLKSVREGIRVPWGSVPGGPKVRRPRMIRGFFGGVDVVVVVVVVMVPGVDSADMLCGDGCVEFCCVAEGA